MMFCGAVKAYRMLGEAMDKYKRWTRTSPAEVQLDVLQVYTLMMPVLEFYQSCIGQGRQYVRADEKKRVQFHSFSECNSRRC